MPKSQCGIEGLRGGVRFCIFINVSTPDSQARKGALQTMALNGLLKVREASAHCDIPCGIYDPILAKIAAQTVLKMVMRIDALDGDDLAAHNSLARYITVKEEHAALCKSEINILANDYFKPEHLEAHPDLPSKVWAATGLASANK